MSCSAITANIRPAAEYWFALFALLETIGLYGNNGARQAYDSYDERMRHLPRFVFTMQYKYDIRRICRVDGPKMLMVQAYRNGTNCNYNAEIKIDNATVFVDGIFDTESTRQTSIFYMGLASAITGFFRIWRQNGHQIKVDVRNAFVIDELLFRPNAKCSRGSDGGIIQIAVTQFLFKEYVWDEFDVIVDKGSPLFVDFGELLKLSYRNYPFMQYFKNPKMGFFSKFSI
ncbi:hypothetical protein Tcan_04868 [Toxocara canis]|uniref:Uncharacterized protein n=1 Tax=Toxocara canis TaxID=6265 RepID=A0A0B2VKM3_TOXCA|nr:hypothetical protein Tcan_04868 [Toxocara canis]